MTQEAIVTGVYNDGTADVVVERAALCGGDCSTCESCMYENTIKARVKNPIDAPKGAHVYLETDSLKILLATVAIYVVPLILFFIGYGIASLFTDAESTCVIGAFVGLLIGFISSATVLRRQHRKNPTPSYIREIIPRFD